MATMAPTTAEVSEVEAGMTDGELSSLLEQFAAQAVGEEWDEIASEQERAINYYYGRMPDLPAQPGQSSVTSDAVSVTVDDAMADILKPFVSTDNVVEFEPFGPEDEEQAEQATEFVNYVLMCDNDGFLILFNWFKDALLTKLGITKTWWEDMSRIETEGVLTDALGVLQARLDPEYSKEVDNEDGTYTVTLNRMKRDGRIRVACIPPEEFKISPYSRTVDTAVYAAHVPNNTTRSDLVAMGYDQNIVDALPAWSGVDSEEGRTEARYQDERFGSADRQLGMPHSSQELVAFREEYIRVDYDGDGIAELRKVHRVADTILLNEEWDEVPFATLCPVPMPHKVYGRSLADQTNDLQRIETVLWRQMLDNLYKTNNPRPVVGDQAHRTDGLTAESLQDTAAGAAIMVKDISQFRFDAVPFVGRESFPMLTMIEEKRAARTGFQRMGNSLDPDSINKQKQMTATQASIQEGKQNSRGEMIARIFAETGVKGLMKIILHLLVKHQPAERIIRLRNKWVPIDPRSWNPKMDLRVNVGLGMGSKNENLAQAELIGQAMDDITGSPFSELVTVDNAYNGYKNLLRAAGVKNIDDYATEPAKGPDGQPIPKEKAPDPALVKAQSDAMLQEQKLQGEQALNAAKLDMQREEAALKLELQREEAAAQIQLAREKADAEYQLALLKQDQEMQLAERRMQMEEDMAARKATIAEDQALSKNRPGGDLDK